MKINAPTGTANSTGHGQAEASSRPLLPGTFGFAFLGPGIFRIPGSARGTNAPVLFIFSVMKRCCFYWMLTVTAPLFTQPEGVLCANARHVQPATPSLLKFVVDLAKSILEGDDAKATHLLPLIHANDHIRQVSGTATLHYAITRDMQGTVSALCKRLPVDELEGGYGGSPLCTAIEWGSLGSARILLSAGVSPNATRGEEKSRFVRIPPLHMAIQSNSLEFVGVLLDAGATVDSRALANAIKVHSFDIFKILFEGNGKNLPPTDLLLVQLLGHARTCKFEPVERFLVHLGVEEGGGSRACLSFVHLLRAKAFKSATSFMKSHGPDLGRLYQGVPLVDLVVESKMRYLIGSVFRHPVKGDEMKASQAHRHLLRRALLTAIRLEDAGVVQFLLSNPALQISSDLPLVRAIKTGNCGIARVLIERGAPITLPAVSLAITLNDCRMVELLLGLAPAHILIQARREQWPLVHVAVGNPERLKIVPLLLKHGACIDCKDPAGLSPLAIAQGARNSAAVKVLEESIAFFHSASSASERDAITRLLHDSTDSIYPGACIEGTFALFKALQRGFLDLFRTICDNKNVETSKLIDVTGYDAMNCAASLNYIPAVKILLDRIPQFADFWSCPSGHHHHHDPRGLCKSPIEIAINHDHKDLFVFFLKRMGILNFSFIVHALFAQSTLHYLDLALETFKDDLKDHAWHLACTFNIIPFQRDRKELERRLQKHGISLELPP